MHRRSVYSVPNSASRATDHGVIVRHEIATLAPISGNLAMVSASSRVRARLIMLGTLSARSLASLSSNPVTSPMALITFILSAPANTKVGVSVPPRIKRDKGGHTECLDCHSSKLCSSRLHALACCFSGTTVLLDSSIARRNSWTLALCGRF